MNTRQKALLLAFFVFAVAYVGTLPVQPYAGSYVIKAVPEISLALLAIMAIAGLKGRLLFVALLFSAAGDVVLGLEGDYFEFGLGFFLVTQVLYAVTFSRDFKAQRSRIPVFLFMMALAVTMAVVLTPSLDEMIGPVYVYLIAILAMGVLAAFRASRSPVVLFGVLLFMASDSILAINEFRTTVPAADYLVMVPYYLAQLLIVYGIMRDE